MGTHQGNQLTHNSAGNPRTQSLAKSLWTDARLKSEIDVSELISTLQKKSTAKE